MIPLNRTTAFPEDLAGLLVAEDKGGEKAPNRPRRVKTSLVVAAAALGLLAAVPASPAEAHETCVRHPAEPSVVCVRNNHHTVDVCDRDSDRHYTYARVVNQLSYPYFQSPFYDSNGSTSGCENVQFFSRVLRIAVCTQYEGCSAFKDA